MDMVRGMQLSSESKCVKNLMFIFNLLFVITGIVLLSVGSVILGVYHNYAHFLDIKFFSVPTLMIAIGAIIFLIAFFGCCGAARENYYMIVMFTTLMILVFVFELAGGISGYVLRNRANVVIEKNMNELMKQYNHSEDIAYVWDSLQRDFQCCGTINPNDWINITGSNDLPLSCCEIKAGTIGSFSCNTNTTTLNDEGCLTSFQTIIKTHAVQLGAVGIGIAFVQAIGIVFSIYLARSIRNTYESV
ncbi:CD63 antigen isoform X2 [Cephus cinctus]|nr:CD63 antigen isoform X2 [Cephus cinctus]